MISMGVMGAACQDKAGITKPEEPVHTNATAQPNPDMTPHVNATAVPTPSVPPSAPPSAVPSAGVKPTPHTINAPPQPASSSLK